MLRGCSPEHRDTVTKDHEISLRLKVRTTEGQLTPQLEERMNPETPLPWGQVGRASEGLMIEFLYRCHRGGGLRRNVLRPLCSCKSETRTVQTCGDVVHLPRWT